MRSFGIVLAVGLVAWAADVRAGTRHCGHCGCRQNCKKVCRLVCGTKKETKTEYSCECEDFCVPGPSRKCGEKYECDCQGHKHRRTIWQPTCAEVRTRRILIKKEVSKEVPDYKWVVEEICRGCGHCLCRTEQADAPSLASIADDSEVRTVSATSAIPDDAERATASDQVALEPSVDGAVPAVDETEPTVDGAEPAVEKAEPADREASRAQPPRASRFFKELLRMK